MGTGNRARQEIPEASLDIEFQIRFEMLNIYGFPTFYNVKSVDVINYTLLGNEEGDRLYESTRSRDLPWLSLVTNTASILNEQMEKNLEAIDDSTKAAEIMQSTRIMEETVRIFYHDLFNFQLKMNRELRTEAHSNRFMVIQDEIP